MKKDELFKKRLSAIKPFEFNENVAAVFDDMAERSIPFYKEVQRMIVELSLRFFKHGTRIYDLGCSTGTTSVLLAHAFRDAAVQEYEIIGIDSSQAMCDKACEKLERAGVSRGHTHIRQGNIVEEQFEQASVVIMNYTLQFIDPLKRETLIDAVFGGLCRNGILIVSDKMLQSSTDVSRIFANSYYDFKRRNGYSELEISQKRDALENILIPYHVKEEESLFYSAGFASVDIFFSWYNFTSFLCMKR